MGKSECDSSECTNGYGNDMTDIHDEAIRKCIAAKYPDLAPYLRIEKARVVGVGQDVTLTVSIRSRFQITDEVLARERYDIIRFGIEQSAQALQTRIVELGQLLVSDTDTYNKFQVVSRYGSRYSQSYFVVVTPRVAKDMIAIHPDTYYTIMKEHPTTDITFVAQKPGDEPDTSDMRTRMMTLPGDLDDNPKQKRKTSK